MAIVFGGRSPEHGISCVSAGSVLGALDPDEFEVVPVGITRAGQWVLTSGDPGQLAIDARRLPEITAESGTDIVLRADPTGNGLMVLDPTEGPRALADVDVVFPVLHGAYGEDGTIQGMLEMAGIPYVGANVFASAAAMDKEFTKKLCAAEGIPVGPYAVLRNGMTLSEADKERLGLPVFVKPSRAGSSFGISKVDDWADLDAAVAPPGRSTRRCSSRGRSSAARSSAACWRARPVGRRRRPCSPRSGWSGTTTSTTSRRSTSTPSPPASTTSPPACRSG